MKFRARTSDKRELEIRWDLINTYVSKWKPGTLLDVTITRRQSKKSDPLRKYYFGGVIKAYMKHLGYEPDEEMLFHRQLKIVYFQIKPDNKGMHRNIPSVFSNESNLDVSVKKKFTDWVIRKAAHDGVYIEDPN